MSSEVRVDGWDLNLLAVHPGGLRHLGTAVRAARDGASGDFAARHAEAMQRLQRGESLRAAAGEQALA